MIQLKKIQNIGETDIRITVYSPDGDGLQLLLPGGSATSLFVLPPLEPGVPIEFGVQLASGVLRPRNVALQYQEVGGKNAFFYSVAGDVAVPAGNTSPLTDISMMVRYDGDGIVIVGTADF